MQIYTKETENFLGRNNMVLVKRKQVIKAWKRAALAYF